MINFKSLLIVIFFVLFSFQAGYGEESFPFIGVITSDRVNLRAGQSQNFESLMMLEEGQEVVVVGKNFSWYKIRMPLGVKSYISADYVELGPANVGTVSAQRVNLRAGPGVQFTILGRLHKGERIKIQEKLERWYQIDALPDSHGWVLGKYVAFQSQTTLPEKPKQNLQKKALIPPEPVKMKKKESVVTSASVSEEKGVAGTLDILSQEEDLKEIETPSQFQEPESDAITGSLESRLRRPSHDFTPKSGPLTVVGRLEPLDQTDPMPSKDIAYKLIVDSTTIYYLEGHRIILDGFRYYKVKVTGDIGKDQQQRYRYPIIVVSKINLVL